jgi:Protein of unknown function (DUF4245)
MFRVLVAGLTVAALLCGCMGGSDDDGTLDPAVLKRAADRATFQVRVPELGATYRLLNVSWTGGADQRLRSVSYDVVGDDGHSLTVEQAEDSGFGVIRTYTKGATSLGTEQIGGVEWSVYSQPSVGGPVLVHSYEDGVEVAVFGGSDRAPLRALAGSLT